MYFPNSRYVSHGSHQPSTSPPANPKYALRPLPNTSPIWNTRWFWPQPKAISPKNTAWTFLNWAKTSNRQPTRCPYFTPHLMKSSNTLACCHWAAILSGMIFWIPGNSLVSQRRWERLWSFDWVVVSLVKRLRNCSTAWGEMSDFVFQFEGWKLIIVCFFNVLQEFG